MHGGRSLRYAASGHARWRASCRTSVATRQLSSPLRKAANTADCCADEPASAMLYPVCTPQRKCEAAGSSCSRSASAAAKARRCTKTMPRQLLPAARTSACSSQSASTALATLGLIQPSCTADAPDASPQQRCSSAAVGSSDSDCSSRSTCAESLWPAITWPFRTSSAAAGGKQPQLASLQSADFSSRRSAAPTAGDWLLPRSRAGSAQSPGEEPPRERTPAENGAFVRCASLSAARAAAHKPSSATAVQKMRVIRDRSDCARRCAPRSGGMQSHRGW